jgi:hypothetical protein
MSKILPSPRNSLPISFKANDSTSAMLLAQAIPLGNAGNAN